jgi:DNA-directed RNA polymerase specialized sigma24 family protein
VQNGGMSIDRPSAATFRPVYRSAQSSDSAGPILAQRFGVAYRNGDLGLAEKLHRELFKMHFYKVQLFCERRIIRMQTALAIFEAEDIAIEAWEAVIHLIQKSQLEIQSENHFVRLLFKTAKHRFLDRLRRSMHRVSTVALERPSTDGSYTVEVDSNLAHATSDRPAWLSDNPTLNLLQSLFAGEVSFTKACAVRPKRRAKVYQTAILYLLITETMVIETDIPPHVPYILAACGLQQSHWDAFLSAMGGCEYPDPDTILAATNIVFETNIQSRRSVAVLKSEFTQMVSHPMRRRPAGSSTNTLATSSPPRTRQTRTTAPQAPATPRSQRETPGQAAQHAPHPLAQGRHPLPNLRGNA